MLINGLKHHQSHRKNLKSDLIMQVTWPHTLAIWSPKFEIPLNAPIYSCLIRCNTINYRLLGFVLRCGIWPPARCNYYSLFNKQWKAKEAVDKGPSTRFGINRALNSPRFGPVWDLLHSKFGIPPQDSNTSEVSQGTTEFVPIQNSIAHFIHFQFRIHANKFSQFSSLVIISHINLIKECTEVFERCKLPQFPAILWGDWIERYDWGGKGRGDGELMVKSNCFKSNCFPIASKFSS